MISTISYTSDDKMKGVYVFVVPKSSAVAAKARSKNPFSLWMMRREGDTVDP
jgi:hypothetical protein